MVDLSPYTANICTPEPNILDAIRQILKKNGMTAVTSQNKADLCLETLAKNDEAWLLLDWAIGEADAVKILKSVQESSSGGVRPIFLFSRTEVEGLEGVAIEFGVMQLHTGEMSRDIILERVENLATKQVFSKGMAVYIRGLLQLKKQGDYQTLRQQLLELNEKKPLDPFIIGELAEDYLRTNACDEAIALLKPLTDQPFKNPRLLNILGRCLMRKGLFEDASVALNQADLINPFHVERLVRLGEAYLQINNPQRAEGIFKRALKLEPENKPAKIGTAKSLLLGGDINQALVFLRQLSSDAEMASVFNVAAVIAIRGGRHEEGMKLYRIACRTIGSKNPAILAKLGFNMGLACYRKKFFELAHYYFVASIKLDETYERARTAAATLAKVFGSGSALTFAMDADLLKALLKDDFTKTADPLADADMKIGDGGDKTQNIDFNMDF